MRTMTTAAPIDDLDGTEPSPTEARILAELDRRPVGATLPARALHTGPVFAAAPRLDLAAAIAAVVPPGVDLSAGPVHRCECSAPVPTRGDVCPPCAERHSAEFRRMALAKAWATIPAGWDHADLANPKLPVRKALGDAVANWTRSTGNMLLCGDTGTGKSTAAIALSRRILRTAERTALPADDMAFAVGLRFMTARALVAAERQHKLGAGTDSPLYRAAARATLLVLDEVGFEPKDERHMPIQRLVEDRYDDQAKRTVVTTGLTLTQLADRYGAANVRRMGNDHERGLVVEVFRNGGDR